ncbi:MAG: glutathione-disulfide reductase [Gammaproteobacteria bacterium]|nr:glutathione-disulfide reductase [Gammaproteobacteria bacterium]
MAEYDYDLFTIGIGSGGTRASRMSASYGARVAAAEERYYGGTCVNVGCVPKKLLVYASQFSEDFFNSKGFGWSVGDTQFDWAKLIANKNTEINRLNGIYERLLNNAGVKIFDGRARLVDPHTVAVNGEQFTSRYILVAVGGWPVIPDIPGKELAITSNEAFYLQSLPGRVIVVGGGYIAVEFAGIFNGLGASVTQLYRGPQFLRGFDDEVRGFLAEEMIKKGVDLRFNANIARIDKNEAGLRATLEDGSTLDADLIMYATGRAPLTQALGLEAAGVATDKKGAIIVDDYFKTNIDSVYAIGDVIDRVALTPVAIAEGMALSSNLFKGTNISMDYTNIPTAVFSQPNIGTCGLTEAQARECYGEIDIYRSSFTPMKHTLTGTTEKTLMKLIVDPASDRVVGFHMVGPDAGETTQGVGIAMKCGATKAQFDATVGIHPTAAEEFVTMREKVA